MKKKLTLVVDDKVIDRAKRLAKSRNVSVSEIVEQYLLSETTNEEWTPQPGSILSKITGAIVPVENELNDDDRRESLLRDKYA
jgi:hypothetical protein